MDDHHPSTHSALPDNTPAPSPLGDRCGSPRRVQSGESLAPAAAYGAAVFFALHLFTYFVPSIRDATLATAATTAVLLGILAVVQHLVVFSVVAALPAPRWAQVAAYIWLVIDMGTDLAQLGGAPKSA